MTSFEWKTVEYQGEETSGRLLSTSNGWSVIVFPDFDEDMDRLVCYQNESVVYEMTLGAPNAGDLTPDGTAIIADWIKYGQRTNSEIHLLDIPNRTSRSFNVEYSAPLVAITPDGTTFAITNYDGKVDIYDSTDFSLQAQHSALFGDRLIPVTKPGENDRVYLRARDEPPIIEYSIGLTGEIYSLSDDAKRIQYIESFDLDNTTDWGIAVPELCQQYTGASSDYVRKRVAEVFDDGSLAHVTDSKRLKSIIEVLEHAHEQFSDPHSKAVAAQLSDAHYRLGKEYRGQGQITEFFDHLGIAESYAEDVLPWFAGKKLLAKVNRRKARVYKQRGELEAARTHINRILEIEKEYDVSLTTDADDRLRHELKD
ncbi:hypothetical protein SAMN04488067_11189 [Halorubrum xinjiangense]|uniref:Uncharacterized protein n=1 Tax=Halorubrum xinjiangense TaxID=261291 RepID=A0A1G7Q8W2_9EURY|nr:hypothetical protein [Halorubrum xinjiangense]SDF94971.1 hypothetical protein SAMN04488067_11189 [Halorubrum xinjiangense]